VKVLSQLALRKLRLPAMSKGQAIIARAQLASGDLETPAEDVMERLNRHERRVVQSEAKQHRRELEKRAARKKMRAERKRVEL
jgi:hypothetical protein